MAHVTSCFLLSFFNTAVNFHLTHIPGKGLEVAQWVARQVLKGGLCQELLGACGPQRCPTREGPVALVLRLQHGGPRARDPADTMPERDPSLAAGQPRAHCQGGMKFLTVVLESAFCPSSPLPLSHICSDLQFSLL